MSEQLDVVEPTGRVIGPRSRDDVHREGDWHQVVHCMVVRSDPPARVVLQLRTTTTSTYPGRLDLTVTGHMQAGESPSEGMLREIAEEIGVEVEAAQLAPLGRRLLADDHGAIRNREVMHVYLLVDDRPLTDYPLDPEHVGGVVEIATADLLRVLADPAARVECAAVLVDGQVGHRLVGYDDLVPPMDGYWTVVTVMAERFVAGERPLAV
jgi:isopentenyldiphosphate isomerase